MVTHRIPNFIMLISNLPSVRSSRYKPNVGNRVIRLSLSFFLFLPLFFFHSTVTPCPSFCQIRSLSLALHICTATKTTTMKKDYNLLLHIFFFVSAHRNIYIHIRFSRSPSGERKKGQKRVAPLPLRQLNSCIFFSLFAILRFSNFLSLSLPTKWLRCIYRKCNGDLKRKYLQSKKKNFIFLFFSFVNHMVVLYSLCFMSTFCQRKKISKRSFNRKGTKDFNDS